MGSERRRSGYFVHAIGAVTGDEVPEEHGTKGNLKRKNIEAAPGRPRSQNFRKCFFIIFLEVNEIFPNPPCEDNARLLLTYLGKSGISGSCSSLCLSSFADVRRFWGAQPTCFPDIYSFFVNIAIANSTRFALPTNGRRRQRQKRHLVREPVLFGIGRLFFLSLR